MKLSRFSSPLPFPPTFFPERPSSRKSKRKRERERERERNCTPGIATAENATEEEPHNERTKTVPPNRTSNFAEAEEKRGCVQADSTKQRTKSRFFGLLSFYLSMRNPDGGRLGENAGDRLG